MTDDRRATDSNDPRSGPASGRSGQGRNIVLGTAIKAGRVGAAAGNLVLSPFRAAARAPLVRGPAEQLASTGRDAGENVRHRLEAAAADVLETPEAERAVDRVLAGPLPETVARSMVEHHVLERMVNEVLANSALDERVISALERPRTEELARRVLASPVVERLLTDAVESKLTLELTGRLMRSPEFQRQLRDVLSSPEVRSALTEQATTFAGETAERTRQRASRLDAAVERGPRRLFGKAARDRVPYGGIASRGVALVVDGLFITLTFLIGGALVGLVASLFGKLRPEWLVGTLVGGGWLLVVAAYFLIFWSTTGQTPGMRLMRVTVRNRAGDPPGVGRSVVRLVGLALAIVPMFAGFLPVLVDDRRRALQDFLAGTVVLHADDATRLEDVAPT